MREIIAPVHNDKKYSDSVSRQTFLRLQAERSEEIKGPEARCACIYGQTGGGAPVNNSHNHTTKVVSCPVP